MITSFLHGIPTASARSLARATESRVRLGGTESTFDLVDVDYSRQHGAQWIANQDGILCDELSLNAK